MYILVFSFQFMADKDSQRNADGEEHDETAEQLPQPYAVQEMHVCGTDADEGCRKEDECLYHAPESGGRDNHAVTCREAPDQFGTLAFHPVAEDADGLAILLQRFSHAFSLLHLLGIRKCPVYF